MSIEKKIWSELPKVPMYKWRKPMPPLAMRLKKAELNVQRRMEKSYGAKAIN